MLGLIATIRIKEGCEKEFEQAARQQAEQVRSQEPGCLLYSLHKGQEPGVYVFMEQYKDQAALEAHGKTEHMKAFNGKVGPLVAGRPDISVLPAVE